MLQVQLSAIQSLLDSVDVHSNEMGDLISFPQAETSQNVNLYMTKLTSKVAHLKNNCRTI